ncbi:uncharacterized protein PV07_02426 [Cladophialophora immunda]|uniref:Transmembrane protein n=1 Tax=Cladophialophora immunda TaxID=569365 RepID=A0A0D2CKW7_9EURO|nr:uncharacterized protein PV07_02426 [Cladophialophora immunda]KIW30720.1 hypothetical protein PV07_02426 [Cladophialophora immunda]OQU99204.1 hypothetical protein CLAIMM_04870 [Cladophialophora immunda]
MASKTPEEVTYELLGTGETSREPPAKEPNRSIRSFIWHNPLIPIVFAIGTAFAVGCFAFTHWLGTQKFVCPDWALDCSVSEFLAKVVAHLGQVQGIITAVYTASVAMMAYATFQVAETTLWPALTKRTFSLCDMDQYLALTRGSLAASPRALWHARGALGPAAVLLTVTVIALLQLASSIFVGHAYSTTNVTTTYYSNHSDGGGMGLPFDGFQMNPPGMLPGAVGDAVSIYTSWANGLSSEPMPDQRNFIIDRANLSAVGAFSAYAIESHTTISCSAVPINITSEYSDIFTVKANMSATDLWIRQQPQLSLWVDRWRNLSDTRAVTTMMFAAINGTIEGGHKNGPTEVMLELGYIEGVSSLACDIDVELKDSVVCTWKDQSKCPPPSMTLSKLETLGQPCSGCISVWLAAAVEVYGVSIYGTQPMFYPTFTDPGVLAPAQLGNLTATLPVAWTSVSTSPTSYAWPQKVLRNFVEVGSGAIAMTIMRHFPNESGILESQLPMLRLQARRSWLLFLPPALVLVSVLLVAALSGVMHADANLAHVRLGTTSEIVLNSQTEDIKSVVNDARKSATTRDALSRLRVRYGIVAEGGAGLARRDHVTSFQNRLGSGTSFNGS